MEITQLTTTRVAPIDFTVNAVAELRISKLRDSDEDFSLQVHYVISVACKTERLNRPFFAISPDGYASLLMQSSTFALSMERHFLIQQSQFRNTLNLHL